MSAEQTVPDPLALWTSSAFVEEVRAWVAAQLKPRGSWLTGEWEQPHTRVWSSTIRFETTEGRLWFKVNASGTVQEPGLLAVLDELRPGLAPEVIAYDDARAWSLARDGGPMLRSRAEPDALWDYWERLAPIRRGAARPSRPQKPFLGYRSSGPESRAAALGVPTPPRRTSRSAGRGRRADG